MTKQQADLDVLRMMPSVRYKAWARFYDYAERFFNYRCQEMAKRYPIDAPLRIEQRVRRYVANRDAYEREHKNDNA